MAEKLSGMEMMMHSLLKAAGFNPQELIATVEKTVTGFQQATEALQARLNAIDETNRIMSAQLERIEKALEISGEGADNGASQTRRLAPPQQ